MKTTMLTAVAIFSAFFMTSGDKDQSRAILGKWCNPYTYQSYGEIRGFDFKKGGKCDIMNVATLDLKSWEIKDGKLIIRGESINKDGTRNPYETIERIEKLTKDTMVVIAQEENPKLTFLYVRPAIAKKAYPNPGGNK